jgi:choline dehydrogenase-like flavoprotein
MPTPRYDVIVIGTGAGGGTLAHALAPTGAEILVLERGDFVPREPENTDPAAVWKHKRYQTAETWSDEAGNAFRPYTHYCVGGNTKFWGSVLYRLRREDFGVVEHLDGVSPAWPIDYDTLEPYYARAERLYHVHGESGSDPTEAPRGPFPYPAVPHADGMVDHVETIRRLGLHPSPLPLGLRDLGEPGGCILCGTCNSFPCRLGAKSDADVCCVEPIIDRSNVTLWTNAYAQRVLTDASGQRVEAVEVERGGQTRRVEAPLVVVSCGAVNSAALLLRSSTDRHRDGLANSSGLVGRRYMAHVSTMMQGLHPFRKNRIVFQKTVGINDFYLQGPDGGYPLGHIQSQGRTHGVMAQTAVPSWPLWAFNAWVARGVDWLAMTEDLPRVENRVTLGSDGRIRLSYRPTNEVAHDRLLGEVKRLLRRLGCRVVFTSSHKGVRFSALGMDDVSIGQSAKEKNTTHQCGTLCFGTDPRHSVLDPFCRSHDVENLFVVDASFFPSSAAVNPGLTIAAQALRVADHITKTALH